MREHRPRLSDDDMSLITSALRARLAMQRGQRRERSRRLLERLEDTGRGNPIWRFGWESIGDREERLAAARQAADHAE